MAKREDGGGRYGSQRVDQLPQRVDKCLSEIRGMKRVRFKSRTRDILRDPLLWLRVHLQHSDDERLNAVFGRLELCDANAGNMLERNRLCDESLEGEGRIEALKTIFSAASDVKDGDLRAALFSDLPSSVRESVPADEISVREQGVSDSGRVQKGIVSDLYHRPNGGWEGYISSITEKGAVYKFTSTSCVCPFLVCLGSTIEFCPSTKVAGSVTDVSVRPIDYFPGTLPESYAADYLRHLEEQGASECLERIIQLTGPLKALLHEPALYTPHQSQILSVLQGISNVDFSRIVVKLGIHESSFLGSLPNTLCMAQSTPEAVAATRESVVLYLSLVSICVCTCPDIAYKLSAVIQSCARLVGSFGEEFSLQGPNLCKAVIHACSVVRSVECFQDQITEDSNTQSRLDPLMWVTHFFGKPVASSLRKHIPGSLLREDESGVITRRKLENIILSVAPTGPDNPTKILSHMCLEPSQSVSNCEELSQKTGIVIDLYPNREGYIVLASRKGWQRRSQQIFKLGHGTNTDVRPCSIHVGDVVQFLVSSSAPDTVERVVRVKQYCSEALEVNFANDYFSQNEVNHFENEAAMRAILNAPRVYTSPNMCTKLVSIAYSALSDSVAASMKKKMLALLKSSSFILDIIKVAPEEVTKSMKVLEKYLQCFPNEVCTLRPTLESMVDLLQKQDRPLELAEFVSFLSSSTCLLPHSVEIARQPWQSVPTLLTEDEWKSGAVANKEYLPCAQDHYASVHEYGRTYFLLLRADCYRDLASSIHRLREQSPSHSTATEEAVVVYDATLTGFSNYSFGQKLVYHLSIRTQPQHSENVPTDSTPLLITGNLLCLSIGGRFEDDIVWATINHVNRYIHRDPGGIKMVSKLVLLCTS